MKQYQNREWLYDQYWKKELSKYQIAELCGVSLPTIKRWFKRFDISCRSISEAMRLIVKPKNHCNLSQEAIEWISGELLGDGSMRETSSCSAQFEYGSKYLDYIQYVSDTLKSFGIKQLGKIRRYYFKKFNCYRYSYASLPYAELLPIRKQWYPEGKKIVPKDLELTPIMLRQHYIGDGNLAHQKKQRPYIRSATYGFTTEGVELLIKQLINLGFKATRTAQNTIGISTYSTKAFLEYIGPCPVKCYQYKWNYQDKRRLQYAGSWA